jgi:hypothetical protein
LRELLQKKAQLIKKLEQENNQQKENIAKKTICLNQPQQQISDLKSELGREKLKLRWAVSAMFVLPSMAVVFSNISPTLKLIK